MDILEKRIRIKELSDFEKVLSQLNDIDMKLIGEVKEVKKESFIIERKFILIPHLKKIDFSRVRHEALEKLNFLLAELGSLGQKIRFYEMKIVDLEKSKFKEQDRRLLEYIRKNTGSLFSSMETAEKKLNDILTLPALYSKPYNEIRPEEEKEWEDDLNVLVGELNRIKEFCRELEHYSQFWEERMMKKPFIDAVVISKGKRYRAFFDANPEMQRRIIEVENRIETWNKPAKELHSPLHSIAVHGADVKHPLHAHIDENFRIVYLWDSSKKHLMYVDILTHNEIDRLREVHWNG